MHPKIAEFFVNMLTDPGDVVFDPFAGSNTTGATAESMNRRWASIEPLNEYVLGSRGRFPKIAAISHHSG
jgi:site-specific DNA-methyltransferase (cytosine-N4-specific)